MIKTLKINIFVFCYQIRLRIFWHYFPLDNSMRLITHFYVCIANNQIYLKTCIYNYISQPLLQLHFCLLKVNNRNTRTRCEICSKLTIKTPERRQWRRFGVFIFNLEHISHLVLMFLLLTLSRQMPTGESQQDFSEQIFYLKSGPQMFVGIRLL